MKNITLKLVGTSPLIVHADTLANPLCAQAKAHKVLTDKKKKTEEDQIAIAKSELLAGLYWDDEKGPVVPCVNVRKTIENGAKLSKQGASIRRAVIPLQSSVPIEYKGPRDKESIWGDGLSPHVYGKSVVVNGKSRVMRYRPIFKEWALTVDMMYDPSVIDQDQLVRYASDAGLYIGLGDNRPDKGGQFGRFEVSVVG